MVKIKVAQMRAQIELIASKLSAGYTDSEIIRDLKIPQRTYYSYKARIYVIFGDLAARKTEQALEAEVELAKDRFIRLYRNLEARIYDDTQSLDDVAYASDIAANIAANILRLEVEGLHARQQRGLNLVEQKAIRYIGDTAEKYQTITDTETTDNNGTVHPSPRNTDDQQPNTQESTRPGGFEEKVF